MGNNGDSKNKQYTKAALEGAAADTVSRYGSGIGEYVSAYDNKHTKKSLKSISKYKISSKQNIKQQAGFSFEVMTSASENAENMIKGNGRRSIRTDDMSQQITENGSVIGGVNDPLYDIAEVNNRGTYIKCSGRQLKFVGNNGTECADKILNKSYDKYRNEGVVIEIPSDYYDDAIKRLNNKADTLRCEIKNLEKAGDYVTLNKKREQLERIEKTKLKRSRFSKKDILKSRVNPFRTTVKEIGKVAHRAGVEQAKTGAILSGAISIIKNFVSCIKNEITPKEAGEAVLKDIGVGAAFSYITAFSGAVAKGIMQNSSAQLIQGLAKTNFASGLVSSTVDIGKTIIRMIRGDISPSQCIEELGEDGFSQLGSVMYASLALLAVKGTKSNLVKIAATTTGSVFGYAAATVVYKELSTVLKEYQLAVEERKRIEAEVKESIDLICQYRDEMNSAVELYMKEHYEIISYGFCEMDRSILENDADGFISGNVIIQKKLGHIIQFNNQKEFDEIMLSDECIII